MGSETPQQGFTQWPKEQEGTLAQMSLLPPGAQTYGDIPSHEQDLQITTIKPMKTRNKTSWRVARSLDYLAQ